MAYNPMVSLFNINAETTRKLLQFVVVTPSRAFMSHSATFQTLHPCLDGGLLGCDAV